MRSRGGLRTALPLKWQPCGSATGSEDVLSVERLDTLDRCDWGPIPRELRVLGLLRVELDLQCVECTAERETQQVCCLGTAEARLMKPTASEFCSVGLRMCVCVCETETCKAVKSLSALISPGNSAGHVSALVIDRERRDMERIQAERGEGGRC